MKELRYSLKFFIRNDKSNKEGTTPLYLRYSFSRRYKDISLGENINPDYFSTDSNSLKSKCPNYKELKKKMDILFDEVESVITDYYAKKDTYPLFNQLEKLIIDSRKKSLRQKNKSLPQKYNTLSIKEYFDEFITYQKTKHRKNSTVITYFQFWNNWTAFEESSVKYDIMDLNKQVFERFEIFLMDRGLQGNTIGKQLKVLKNFLNYCFKIKEVKISLDYMDIKVIRESSNFVVMTELDIEKLSSFVIYSKVYNHPILNLDLTEDERYIGRIFLFLCSTGLSYVDYNRLNIDNIIFNYDEEEQEEYVTIEITRQKLNSTEDCVIPIHGRTLDLLFVMLGYTYFGRDYDRKKPFYQGTEPLESLRGSINSIKNIISNKLDDITPERKKDYPRIFPKISDVKFNLKIKKVLEKIGINEQVKVNKKIKNNVVETFVPKYELIASHTGRRSYITWCMNNGLDSSFIMMTTGHKSTQTLGKYKKVLKNKLNQHFNDGILKSTKKLNKKRNKKKKDDDDDSTFGFHIKP
jgi:site-specific recombinase XerD